MTQWYYADAAGTQQGPIDTETLLARYAAGEVQPATLVWREGLPDWQPLSAMATELGLAEADLPAVAEALPPTTSAPEVVYAGFWRRLAANVIDGFAIGLITLPVTLPVIFAAGIAAEPGGEGAVIGSLLAQLAVQLFAIFVTVAWFACFHASRLMASPGKLAVGIKVVRSDGQRLNFGRSLGRGFAYYLSYLTLYIGFLVAAFTQRKQALHDLICDTLVVDRWAFTDQPQRQKRGLDVVTIVILSFYGVLLAGVMLLAAVAVAVGIHAAH